MYPNTSVRRNHENRTYSLTRIKPRCHRYVVRLMVYFDWSSELFPWTPVTERYTARIPRCWARPNFSDVRYLRLKYDYSGQYITMYQFDIKLWITATPNSTHDARNDTRQYNILIQREN